MLIFLACHKTAILGAALPHSRGGGSEGQTARLSFADRGRGVAMPIRGAGGYRSFPWRKSSRTRLPAPRAMLGAARCSAAERKKTSSHTPAQPQSQAMGAARRDPRRGETPGVRRQPQCSLPPTAREVVSNRASKRNQMSEAAGTVTMRFNLKGTVPACFLSVPCRKYGDYFNLLRCSFCKTVLRPFHPLSFLSSLFLFQLQ